MHTINAAAASVQQLQDHPHAILRDDIVLKVEGPGALDCLQGLFTNDLERAGDNSLTWGAVLTPKGMIVTDCWIRRTADAIFVIVPRAGATGLLGVFRRSLPPRLARVTDLRESHRAWWLVGGTPTDIPEVDLATTTAPAPFNALVIAPQSVDESFMSAHGWDHVEPEAAEILGLLAGWPAVGREIDDRTLVQEVRFDELDGVRYDKGCYVGQETVARLHFRGHPNRTMRALVGTGIAPADPIVTSSTEKEVGTIARLLQVDDKWIASIKLRREVENGELVSAGGRPAQVQDFPVQL